MCAPGPVKSRSRWHTSHPNSGWSRLVHRQTWNSSNPYQSPTSRASWLYWESKTIAARARYLLQTDHPEDECSKYQVQGFLCEVQSHKLIIALSKLCWSTSTTYIFWTIACLRTCLKTNPRRRDHTRGKWKRNERANPRRKINLADPYFREKKNSTNACLVKAEPCLRLRAEARLWNRLVTTKPTERG